MRRAWIMAVLVGLLAGCAHRAAYTPDPFLGQTRIAPPATGAAAPAARGLVSVGSGGSTLPAVTAGESSLPWKPAPSDGAAAGSSPAASAPSLSAPDASASLPVEPSSSSLSGGALRPGEPGTTLQPITQADPLAQNRSGTLAGAGVPGQTNPPAATGALGYRATSRPRPLDQGALGPRTRINPPEYGGNNGSGLASRPAPGQSTEAWARSEGGSGAARKLTIPSQIIDIMDLPDTRTREAKRSGGSQRAEATDPAAPAASLAGGEPRPGRVQAASFDVPLRYDHAADYAWLRGKLEYSEADRRWRLRYAPIDGKTDAYGGSVVLSNTEAIAQLKAGDFVEVHGQMCRGAEQDWSYAPVYKIARARPL